MRYIYIICFTFLFALTGQAQTKRTINVATAGTLPNYISESEKYTIEELTLTGNLNGTDFRLLRDMAGNNYKGEITEGKLKVLDMSGAKIVAGGEKYLDADIIYYKRGNETRILGGPFLYAVETANVLPQYLFTGCSNLISVVVPNSVTSIGVNVFRNCSWLTSVTIPNSVTSIGQNAFWECSGLTSIAIPNSVTSIGQNAFRECSGLTSITIPNSVTSIGVSAFCACSGLTSITISNSVTSIDYGTFSGCSGLTSITLPNSVTSIGDDAFASCSGLTSITIPNSVTSIGEGAFLDCSSLTSITIPNSVTSIGQNAFRGCSGLTSIIVESGNKKYDSRNNCNAIIETSSNTLITGCRNTIIPNSVTNIGVSAFSGCSVLTSITIPNSVTSIGDDAFSNCTGLTSIMLPNSVTSIGSSAFSNCTGLTSITLPNSVTSIGVYAFSYCSGLTSITLPNSVTSIASSVFWGCRSLTSVTLPNSVTSIGDRAFGYCSGLTSITLPNSVTSIGGSAFYGCSGLTSLTIPNSVTSIGEGAFYGCSGLTSITIPNSVMSIGYAAFQDCSGLTSITIPNSVTSIGKSAFAFCSGLTSIVSEIVNTFEIDETVFRGSYTTATLTVPAGTKSKYQATKYWNKFTNIVEAGGGGSSTSRTINVATAGTLSNYISESEKYTIEELTLTGNLNGTDFRLLRDMAGNNYKGEITEGKLKVLDMSGANIVAGGEKYLDTDKIYYIMWNETMYWSGSFHYSIDVANIVPQCVFAYCNSLTSVSLPNNVTSINRYAFSNCEGLTTVTIPSSVTTIVDEAFIFCQNLKSADLQNGLTSIGTRAFYCCYSLTSIKIPKSVTSIGNSAFAHCRSLTSIEVDASNTAYVVESGVLFNKNKTTIVCYPAGKSGTQYTIPSSVTTIDGAFAGSENLTSVTIPSGVTTIGNYAFESCNNLASIAIPNTVTQIGDYAFGVCAKLGSVTIPDGVTSIGTEAFFYCSSLASVTIPNSVTSIGTYVFYGCDGLYEVYSEIQSPFHISTDVFSDRTYENATLTVPRGTKSSYQAKNGWKNFTNIVEGGGSTEVTFETGGIQYKGDSSVKNVEVQSFATSITGVEIPSTVTNDGTTYQVTSIADGVFSYRTLNYVSLPSTITSISSTTFRNCTLGALIWNADVSLSSGVFSNMNNKVDANFLLYVNSASYAPSNVENVVVGNTASSITLADAKNTMFYCPRAFTATTITYKHHYSMETGGTGKGWESIALPFDVQKIEHATKGELTPFASYNTNSDQRPFWLYEMGNSGFRRTSTIKANTPYIISMPNNSAYDEEYILTGDVTFSASNATVPVTSPVRVTAGTKTFVPAFATVDKSSAVYPLNVTNSLVTNTSAYDPGSRFVSDLRVVYPFEAYMTTSSSGAPYLSIEFDDNETTDISSIDNGELTIDNYYTLDGVRHEGKPTKKGVYIINGKKVVIK